MMNYLVKMEIFQFPMLSHQDVHGYGSKFRWWTQMCYSQTFASAGEVNMITCEIIIFYTFNHSFVPHSKTILMKKHHANLQKWENQSAKVLSFVEVREKIGNAVHHLSRDRIQLTKKKLDEIKIDMEVFYHVRSHQKKSMKMWNNKYPLVI